MNELQAKVRVGRREPPTRSRIHLARQPTRHEHGRLHEILFYLLLFDGLAMAVDFFYNQVAITLLGIAIGMGVGVCVIVALVKQHGSDMSSAVRGITWASLGYLCFCYSMGYIMSFIFSVKYYVKNPEMINNQWAMIKFFSALSPLDSPWLTGFYVFSIVCSLAIGICGLVTLKKFQGEYHLSPSVSSTHPGEKGNSGQE